MDYVSTDKDYTAIELKKYQWDYIHNPQTMLFAWAEEEYEGASKLFKSNLSLVFYNDSGLINNQTIYFLPDINQEVILIAKQTKNNTLEDVKVNWSYKNQKEVSRITFNANHEFFGDNNLIQIDVTEKVLLGTDSTLTYFIGKIDISPNYIIDSVLMNIKNMQEEFVRLEQEILNMQAANMDFISLRNITKYISRGLSEFYEFPPLELKTDFDKALFRMYSLDLIIKKIDNFDDLIKEIVTIYSQESSKQEFFNNVIKNLETINPLDTKENLERLYKEQIITKTLNELAGRLKK